MFNLGSWQLMTWYNANSSNIPYSRSIQNIDSLTVLYRLFCSIIIRFFSLSLSLSLSMHCCNHIYTLSNLSENTLFKQVFCTAMPHCLMHPSRMDSLPPTLQLVPIHVIICTFLQPTERERGMAVGACRCSVAQCWRLKPEALGSIPGDATFLSYCRFKVLRTVMATIVFN